VDSDADLPWVSDIEEHSPEWIDISSDMSQRPAAEQLIKSAKFNRHGIVYSVYLDSEWIVIIRVPFLKTGYAVWNVSAL
jgi:hypothetical protein